jgi:pyruvate decarboxylase
MDHVPATRLHTPLDTTPSWYTSSQHFAVEAICDALFAAKNPILFVDGNAKAYHVRETVQAIARKLRIPTYAGTMGKAIVDETEEYYAGMYQGVISDVYLKEHFESSDCVLNIGPVDCDTNSGGFTRKFAPNSIRIDPYEVSVNGKTFSDLHISGVLSELNESLSNDETRVVRSPVPKAPVVKPPVDAASLNITQSWVWEKLAAQLQPHDVVFAETGTAVFGLCYERMPADIRFLTQTYYGSIGWATPAALGTELALRELAAEKGLPRGRTVLVTGDGSVNLTIQEIGTMITNGLHPLIIVLNNAGYTIERVIHGARQRYNDINPVNFKHLLAAFSHPDPDNHYYRAETKEEFFKVFSDERLRAPKLTTIVEIVVDKMDVPWRLTRQIYIRGPAYAQSLIDEGFIGEGRVGIGG